MKKLILAAVVALPIIIHPPVEAASNKPADVVCYSEHVRDAGFHLNIRGDRKSASLHEITFAGFGEKQALRCEENIVMAVEGFTQNTLSCYGRNMIATTTVHYFENNSTGEKRAKVVARVHGAENDQEVQFGELRCSSTVN